MIRFLGNIEAKTDAKGRVFIPAGFRKQLQAVSEERLVLRKDVFQDCLVLYPESVWFATQNQLRQRLNKWNAKHQQIFRQFVSDAEIMVPDGNGRILLPKPTCKWQAYKATYASSAWTTRLKSGRKKRPNNLS